MNKEELASFLRARRELLSPRDVGMVEGPRRRAPGLRREEVAQLAGMSTDYYAKLEQQRAPRPSTQITAALARALRLTLDERDHLFVLTGHNAPTRFERSDHVSPALLGVLDSLVDTPCLVQTDLLETLAMNPLAAALLGDQTRFAGLHSSGYLRWFLDPEERSIYPADTHEQHGRSHAARLRAAMAAGSDTARAQRIYSELHKHSTEFVRMWDLHEVAHRYDDCKTILHPALGPIEVDGQVLFTENHSQSLVVLTTRPGSASRGKIDLLKVLGRQTSSFDATPAV
ncbi:helix-turn-helix transcriptional regulator [Agreia sp. PsM10]|uniref:helix-turn-helix transcriptional regulator n=1 Tax=Agreia sp. PsM10 TaxID=3030533 RepID=UPI00263BA3CB|nr:helix-turn-helix transcriptional regulator [Agreia sp. PsM10]MDN4640783.1 helix-turn-helix transcriptional regulator [Agreia sp. PsM10]